MARKDYPWHPSDIKRVNSTLTMLFRLLLMGVQCVVWAVVTLSEVLGSKKALHKKEEIITPSKNRRWLILANDAECDYDRAFSEHGYVYINAKNRRINVGDTIYLYMTNEKRVRYDTMVVAVNVKRQDNNYWNISPPKGATCKLEMIGEYKGKALSLSKLKKNGFNGERTIKLPICNNMMLLDYIEDEFDNMYYSS
ncbi:MAG: hypothetical protein E7066_10835 [Lentimicrobiaceae bacterium]|nr:hypothetical protein [Lentimicrobiaceae bacterium]